VNEDPAYLSTQLVTCLGNNRALLPDSGLRRPGQGTSRPASPSHPGRLFRLGRGVAVPETPCAASGRERPEAFAATLARCYLQNRSEIDLRALANVVAI
jgi:hypothetical protein